MRQNLLKILPFVWLILLIDTNLMAMRNNCPLDKGELRKSLEKEIQPKLEYIISNRNKVNPEETQQELQTLRDRVEKMLVQATLVSVSMAERISSIQVSIENAMKQ